MTMKKTTKNNIKNTVRYSPKCRFIIGYRPSAIRCNTPATHTCSEFGMPLCDSHYLQNLKELV